MSYGVRRRHHAHEKGSLRELIASDPSCFVRVEYWEPEQLKRLNCQVLPISTRSSTADTAVKIKDRYYALWLGELYTLREPKRQDRLARKLFSTLVPVYQTTYYRRDLPMLFHFNKSPVARVPCSLIFQSKTITRPLYAYIDRTWLSDRRRQVCKDRPTCTLKELDRRMKKTSLDPYIAGLLIAMAQKSVAYTTGDIEVHLFSPSKDHKSLIKDSAKISRQYLARLEQPWKTLDCGFTITRKAIRFDQPQLISEVLHEINKDAEDEPEACEDTEDEPEACEDA